MSKRKISLIISVKNYVFSNFVQYFPQYRIVRQNKSPYKVNGLRNRKVFLSPEITNFTSFIHKRNCSCSNDYGRHSYDEKLETLINEQINAEFSAGYDYLNIASYYGRSNVALAGCHGFFMKMYYEEQEHAINFLKYQNSRGGSVRLTAISTVTEPEWPDIPKSFACSLQMEKNVKEKLLNMYKTADQVSDVDVMNMLDTYIEQQEQSICEISRLLTRANELTKCDVGKYLFDRELHETHVKSEPAKCTPETGSKLYR